MFDNCTTKAENGSISKSKRELKSKLSLQERAVSKSRERARNISKGGMYIDRTMHSPVISIIVGHDKRIFAAHEEVLCSSPYLENILRGHLRGKRSTLITLQDEEPEIFSLVLEYLYKGDYTPPLRYNEIRNSWSLDNTSNSKDKLKNQIFHHSTHGELLRDTAIYCLAEKYGLGGLKKIALRKQALHSAIDCSIILNSARYAYANTPETDSKLRAFYLALIIRNRSTFKRSANMQFELFAGGSQLFFDLFVALCNHVDDVEILR